MEIGCQDCISDISNLINLNLNLNLYAKMPNELGSIGTFFIAGNKNLLNLV